MTLEKAAKLLDGPPGNGSISLPRDISLGVYTALETAILREGRLSAAERSYLKIISGIFGRALDKAVNK